MVTSPADGVVRDVYWIELLKLANQGRGGLGFPIGVCLASEEGGQKVADGSPFVVETGE